MESGHFNYFRVKNFKRFRDLEVKDIGQFNLVLGDNNVGKTSLLEALLFEVNFKSFERSLTQILKIRDMYDGLREDVFQLFQNVNSSDSSMTFEFSLDREKYEVNYLFDFEKSKVMVSSQLSQSGIVEFPLETIHNDIQIPFIPFSLSYGKDMFDDFSKFLLRKEKNRKEIIESLKIIHPSIKNIEVDTYQSTSHPTLRCFFDGSESVSMGFLGDGVTKLFRILLEVTKYEFGILLIDEIDTGIHHSRMVEFWKGIIKHSSKKHLQLFATTHNRECIQAYQEALEELGENYLSAARTISLKEHPETRDVIAFTNGIEVLQYANETGNDLR